MKLNPYIICSLVASLSLIGCEKEGEAGKNSLIDQIAEPASVNCAYGGYKIITGIDDNRNNVLDDNEIQKTEYVCNVTYNKETILYYPYSSTFFGASTTPIIANGLYIDLNLANYPADSISFGVNIRSSDGLTNGYAELYDLTNNKVINNSTVFGNSPNNEFKSTKVNLLNELPKSPIKLGLRIRCEKDGPIVQFNNPLIKIYKK